jgi:hypothetical protein
LSYLQVRSGVIQRRPYGNYFFVRCHDIVID